MKHQKFALHVLKYLYENQFAMNPVKIPNSKHTKEKWDIFTYLEDCKYIDMVRPVTNSEDKPDREKLGYKSRITGHGVERYEKIIENERNKKAILTSKLTMWIIVWLTAINVFLEIYRFFI